MENALAALSVVVFAFLLLATGIEIVVDIVRNILIALNLNLIAPLKARISLDEALKLGQEFTHGNEKLRAKAAVMKKFSKDAKGVEATVTTRLESLERRIAEFKEQEIVPADVYDTLAAEYQNIQAALKVTEKQRILILRSMSLVVGLLLAGFLNFNAFEMIREIQGISIPYALLGLPGALITGAAASAGSSYWHDKLSKVRAVKESYQATKSVFIKP